MRSPFTFVTMLATAALLLASHAQAADPVPSATSTNAPRLSVELTDGSRVLGWPAATNFTWTTSFGPLKLPWHSLHSVERTAGNTNFTLMFRNDDHAEGMPGTNVLALRTALGDLAVPFSSTRRILVQTRAGGRGLLAYWSFDHPS